MQQCVQKSEREDANLPKQIFLYKQILKNDTRFCHKNMLLAFAPPKTRFPFLLCTAWADIFAFALIAGKCLEQKVRIQNITNYKYN